MSEGGGFGLLIAIIVGLVVIFFLVMYFYPKIPEIAQMGITNAESVSIEFTKPDLAVNAEDINCTTNVITIHNVGGEDAPDAVITIDSAGWGAAETRTISLPSGSSFILTGFANPFGNPTTIELDSTYQIEEVYETNNNALKACP